MPKLKHLLQSIEVFTNFITFLRLIFGFYTDSCAVLRTRSGLSIRVRNNRWDARIMAETYLDRCYPGMFAPLPVNPLVVDIGGYIGDFTLYAAHELGARVVVYEPTPENYALLKENIALNALEDRVTCHNAGVGSSDGRLTLNVTRGDGALHVSGFLYADASERITVPAVSMSTVFADNDLTHIDLLKIDCEGGEYDIIGAMTGSHFERIDRIVFEYHPIAGFREKMETVRIRLTAAGYRITEDRSNALLAATKV
ncbi:MAG: FkbM family methyltransferase [Desulfuromonadales bacterium]